MAMSAKKKRRIILTYISFIIVAAVLVYFFHYFFYTSNLKQLGQAVGIEPDNNITSYGNSTVTNLEHRADQPEESFIADASDIIINSLDDYFIDVKGISEETLDTSDESIGGQPAEEQNVQETDEQVTHVEEIPAASSRELDLLYLINTNRNESGLPSLNLNPSISLVAESRSNDMISRNYFSHTTPDGKTIFNILVENGIMYAAAGENIQQATPPSWGTPQVFLNAWMSSSVHRNNILSPLYSQAGIGISNNSNRIVAVAVFLN